ncbi:MAG: elongation factor Ts [Proteobacteria bacterium]|nr:elongation factor Ts [Pseudomonadota bacterium]
MSVSASMVKELREQTGAGMMECKKALVAAEGNTEKAIELLRKSGQANAEKKSSRVAADGRIAIAVDGNKAAIAEINSETDFVARGENFIEFAEAVVDAALTSSVEDVGALSTTTLSDGRMIETARTDLVAKVGENISVRRFERVEAADHLGNYTHGARIGVLVSLSGGNAELARDVAMHVAASNPLCVDEDGVPADMLERERRIITEQAADSGKPAEIVEKMVSGRVAKFLREITLLGQSFVKDPDVSVGKLLKSAGATVTAFVRYELGEGIEKKQ